MYLYKNRHLPASFNDMFLLNCEVHKYNTRTENFFRLPKCSTNVRLFSLRFQGTKLHNSLSTEIQNASNISVFTSKLKSSFCSVKYILLPLLVCLCLLFVFLCFCAFRFASQFFYPVIMIILCADDSICILFLTKSYASFRYNNPLHYWPPWASLPYALIIYKYIL